MIPQNPEPAVPGEQWAPAAPAANGRADVLDAPRLSRGRRLHPRTIALFEVLLCSGVPTQFFVALLLVLAGMSQVDAAGRLTLSFVVALSLGDTMLLLALIFVVLRSHGESPRAVFLGGRPVGREVILGLLLSPLVLVSGVSLLAALQRFFPWLHDPAGNPFEHLIRTPLNAWLFGLVGVVAGGIREETQRAFILKRFERHLGGAWVGLAVFSVAFGAGHYTQGADAVIVTGFLGLVWGLIFLWRRSIAATVVSHSVFNVAEVVTYYFFGQTGGA